METANPDLPAGLPCSLRATIQFRAASKDVQDNAAALTASKPAGTTDGDLLIAWASHDVGGGTWTPPGGQGWTAFSLPGTETEFTSRAWYKQVDASDAPRTDYTFTFSTSESSILYLAAFYEDSGTGNWTLEDGTGWAFADPVNTISNGGVTAVDDSLFVVGYGNDDNEVVAINPGGPTPIDEDMTAGSAFAAYYDTVDAVDGSVSYPITWGGDTEQLSAMAGIFSWAGGGKTLDGTVFEDADFVGIATACNAVNDKALLGVDVELYDGGTDAYIASTATAADGSYSFSGLADGSYKVRARSATIGSVGAGPKGGLNVSVPGTWPNPLAEMTWGNGAALYGGQGPTVDDTATGDNAGPEVYVSVTVSGADVSAVDLGFAYNLIVNTTEDSNADNVRSAQGSLRQFIKNANAIGTTGGTTANSSEFRIPTSDPNYNSGTGVFTITPTILLPALADTGTMLDASTQGDNTTQTNAGYLGVGGKVGVDQLDLSTVPAPEVEIAGSETLPYGLRVTAGNGTLRGLAIYGFGLSSTGEGNIFVADSITGPLIEQNVIGSGAAAFTDPGSGFRGQENVYSDGADNGTIQNNLIGYGGVRGIFIGGASLNWTIENNEIRDNAREDAGGDGIAIDPGSADVTGNLIVDSSSQGVVVKGSSGSTFTNNTISGNGIGLVSASGNAAGMTFRSTAFGHTAGGWWIGPVVLIGLGLAGLGFARRRGRSGIK